MKNKVVYGVVNKVNFPNKGVLTTPDGVVVTVADSFVNQELGVRLCRKRKGKWEGRVVEVIKNPDYFKHGECEYFGMCGGCSLQNLPYELQLKHKETQVKDIINAVVEQYEYVGIVSSPSEYGYRNKMEFSFGDSCKNGPLALGLHRKRTTFDIITVDGCKIVNDDFNKILRYVFRYMQVENIPFYKKKTHEGVLRYLVVRRSYTTGDLLVNLVTSSQGNYDFTKLKINNIGTEGKVVGFLHTTSDNKADAVKPEKVDILYGQDFITEEILGLNFEISPFSFFQTNTRGAQVLYEKALGLLSNLQNKVVFDLYSGTGTIAQIMATKAKFVYGIEIIEEAVIKARANALLNGLDNCEFIAGDVLEQIDTLQVSPDIIVLDPPREGIHPKAIIKIINYNAPEILYISCKPTSLAKDLVVLQEHGYNVDKICCVDLFPQTPHIETVCLLSKLQSAII
ncbi:MAG: 23S rRNA (uracil-5-)-methyltransferase RumA [Epulopiscium sp. Nuni2H_MBin001]|nr:MAG: 23S rRNA (uracil-5-)-methyltransferase RumA [Epulopiscium sp. Nuni2H_MBin001]